jgi:hypothetical protein
MPAKSGTNHDKAEQLTHREDGDPKQMTDDELFAALEGVDIEERLAFPLAGYQEDWKVRHLARRQKLWDELKARRDAAGKPKDA